MKEKIDCHTCLNSDCLIRQHIGNEAIEAILDQKHTFTCKKSQQFILEGAPIHGLFFIYKGKAKVTKTGIFGREQIVRFAHEGELIGHRGFATEGQYTIGATALEDTTLCNFSNQTLMNVLRKTPDLTFDLMLMYASELNKSETKVRKLAQMTVREKVIDVFLYLYRKFGQDDEFLNIILSRKDIADFAGTTEEQVIRIISALKKDNLIIAKGKQIGIIDVSVLKKEIAEHNFFIDT